VFGAMLGWRFLGEPMHGPRVAGLGLVAAGCLLAALAM
jgi:drug/metabolite transporter (DMT)-like permease